MGPWWILLVAAATAGMCFFAARQRPRFIVTIQDGKVRSTYGHSPPSFMHEAEFLCREAGLTSGVIKGYSRNGHLVLSFSENVPGSLQQRLRNALVVRC